MGDEVLEFAKEIRATDLKTVFDNADFRGLLRRRNYFVLDKNKFLIVKISRSKIRPFYGLGKAFFDLFNTLTEKNGTYYFVALASNKSGWVLSKSEILHQIKDRSISYSEQQEQYKINDYNLKDQNMFTTVEGFLSKVGMSQ